MIQISKTSKQIAEFLDEKGVEKYKIFIRINFRIDVYILVTNESIPIDYEREFFCWINRDRHPTEFNENSDVVDGIASTDKEPPLKIKFITVNQDEINDPFYANIFSGKEKIDRGPRYRFDSFLKEHNTINPSNKKLRNTPIVTFYSYKGGMGRTTAMIAYAISLATDENLKRKKRVVLKFQLQVQH